MFNYKVKSLKEGKQEYHLYWEEKPVTFQQWIRYMKSSAPFRRMFNKLLKSSPYPAFYWEVPPMTKDRVQQNFMFVIVPSTSLKGVEPMPDTFSYYFDNKRYAVAFPNLGGDAQLVVPTPRSVAENYTHLARFTRQAPADQIDRFWQLVAQEYEAHLQQKPRWLSTCGLGVFWLHVRIDQTPKYYRHSPYTQWM